LLAPQDDRSGVSHSISFLGNPCKLKKIEEDAWSCSGTPADCVIIALLGGLPELSVLESAYGACPPDLVLSGINRGANLGTDIVYSGTAAAARQAGLLGIPSAALSLVEAEMWHWDMAAVFAAERIEELLGYWKPGIFVNVNIPNRPQAPDALVPAFPSLRYYNDSIETYAAPDGNSYCFARAGEIGAKPEEGSDWAVVSGNQASMSAVYIHPASLEQSGGRRE
jgi:5'-nucleotidase